MPSGRKLRIGLVFDDTLDSSDGVAQYVKTLGGWLSSRGHDVSYLVGQTVANRWQGGRIYSLSRNVNVSFNGNRLSMPLLANAGQIKKILNDGHFDVLHVMLPCSPLMAARVVTGAGQSTAVVGTFHIFPSGRLSVIGSKLLRLALLPALRRFDSVVSVSPPAQAFAKSAYRLESDILPNPVRLESFKPGDVKNVKGRIVFLGRLVDRKGCRQLISAFSGLAGEVPGSELVIAGTGPQLEKLKKLADGYGLGSRVRFLGYIEEKDKPELLASAEIACFPSLYGESFGIVLLEAMAAGAGAVLGGDNPGYRSVLGDKPELLVDPRSTRAFTNRLKRLLLDDGLRGQLQAWQAETVRRYDIGTVGPEVLELYRSSIVKADKKSHNTHHGKP